MSGDEAIELIFAELKKAEKKHPGWPQDPIHAAGVLCEEAGELMQAAIDFTYSVTRRSNAFVAMQEEAAQCAAMGLRFLLGIDFYIPTKSEQWQAK